MSALSSALVRFYRAADPCVSKGNKSGRTAETINIAPAMNIGTDVVRLAYKATIGAYNRTSLNLASGRAENSSP